MTNKTSWVLDVKEDPKTGDSMLEFPADLLAQTGWKEGDILEWKDLGNGSWQLTKQLPGVTIEEEEAWQDLERKQTKA
jgi:hypothetical protein